MRTQNEAGTLLPQSHPDVGPLIEATAYLQLAAESFNTQGTKLPKTPPGDKWRDKLDECARDTWELYDKACRYTCMLSLNQNL